MLLQDRACALHEQSSQVRVTTFADTEQLLLTASGMFARNDPQPSRELPPLVKRPSVANCCDDCSCCNGPDPRDLHQSLAGFVLISCLLNHCIGLVNSLSQLIQIQ